MEITKQNFDEELDNITKNIQQSCFIGFDAEFTAILSRENFKHRLFDTNEERYNKIKYDVSEMLMTQIGLTLFQYNRDIDTYTAIGYTFHLCPQAFGNIDQSFIFQASTLRFLCRHNFNFNKFIYEGLPYLSKAEEDLISQYIKEDSLFQNLVSGLEIEDERQVQSYCSEVSKWLSNSNEGTLYLDVKSPILRYIVHNEIRIRFPDVLTTDSLGNSRKVLIYRDKYVEGANHIPKAILGDNLKSSLLGFSQIIYSLASYKKPIIGHNIFLDTVLLHNQFVGPLPKKYSVFKKNITEMFPNVYDTKYISHEMKKKLTFHEVWKSNSLQDLYEFFSEGKCKKLSQGGNPIRIITPFDVTQSYHEAGWDSYCSGYCFIRMGHWAACDISGVYRPVGPKETLAALAPYCNRVNVIRGAILYMNLAGDDPLQNRPDLLHIKALKDRVINVGEVASTLASFGSIDVKPYGSRAALIAANSQFIADRILRQFKNSNEYRVSVFNVYRHGVASRVVLWSGAFLTGTLMLYFFHRKMNK